MNPYSPTKLQLAKQRTAARSRRNSILAALALMCVACFANAASPVTEKVQAPAKASARQALLPLGLFMQVAGTDAERAIAALERIEKNADPSSAALLVDLVYRTQSRAVLVRLITLVEKLSGIKFDGDLNTWYAWLWSQERPVRPDYAEFKALLFESIDPRFREYFANTPKSLIRLDEIRWGGVLRDGIPPLKNPKMIKAREATWLEDDHIVFGVAINGDVRAYPKRILAWHEMFKDRIGGLELAGVYCTLCGALVMYDVTAANGVQHELGTSGFLYRSNKLMYDHATKSMWSTLTGSPVLGPLVGQGIALKSLYVVTTTWKEWRTRHPGTQVLSLDTGHVRDYGEGVAYSRYFGSDALMFNVPKLDTRLPNKAEVLALRLPPADGEALAIAADFLAARPVYPVRLGSVNLVVLTDASGANRVYESSGVSFASWDAQSKVLDSKGQTWQMDEAQLTGPAGEVLKRFSAHRAFWFGWHAAFPDTRLITSASPTKP
jgi:hypothetical protein